MPLPIPKTGESKDDFIERCMDDDTMVEDFPDSDQRLAVCNEQWNGRTAADRERRFMPTELCELRIEGTDKQPIIRGIAAPFDSWSLDLGGFREIIRKGAFKESLERGDDIRALVDHDPGKVIGRNKNDTLRLKEIRTGLKFWLRPAMTTAGRDVVENIHRGDLDGVSIGFKVPAGGERVFFEDDIFKREVLKIDLFEISIVAFPAFPQTEAKVREFLGVDVALRSIERCKAESIALRADFENAKKFLAERQPVGV